MLSLLVTAVLLVLLGVAHCQSAHKVHNIVLYPEKHAWCESRKIRMFIGHEGCEPVIIDNNVCVGQCFSYSVPASVPRNIFDDRLHYCDSCQPENYTWVKVALHCSNPPGSTFEKKVQVVLSCVCKSCVLPPVPTGGTPVQARPTPTQKSVDPTASPEQVFKKLLSEKGDPVPVPVSKLKDLSSRHRGGKHGRHGNRKHSQGHSSKLGGN